MSYQFDPCPDGLHYEPFKVAFCNKTMWWLRDGAPETWIDLRSVFEALCISWVRTWGGYCLARSHEWGLVACFDNKLRETLLVPGNKLPAVLKEVRTQLGNYHAAEKRMHSLHLIWRDKYAAIRAGQSVREVKRIVKKPVLKAKPRKVNAYVVRQAFVLLGKGHAKPLVARTLGVSLNSIQKLAAGTYPGLDEPAANAWWETFGAPGRLPGAVLYPVKRAEQPQGNNRKVDCL